MHQAVLPAINREKEQNSKVGRISGATAGRSKVKTPYNPMQGRVHLHARASQSAEGGLCTGAGGLGLVSSGGAHLDVQGGDAQLLRSRYATQTTNNGGNQRWTGLYSRLASDGVR